jgi:hypothetical protein
MGSPGGSGGGPGSGTSGTRARVIRNPAPGTSGGLTTQGLGGIGGYVTGAIVDAIGGPGGSGGNSGQNGNGQGQGSSCSGSGGAAGSSGFAIIIANDGTGVTIIESGGIRIGEVSPPNTSIS